MRTSSPPSRLSPQLSWRQKMIGACAGLSAVLLGLDGLPAAHGQAGLGIVTQPKGGAIFKKISPDFEGFAVAHPWIGSLLGERQPAGAGFVQRFQNASLYGVIGGEVHEVHGLILLKYQLAGGPSGVLGFPSTDETKTIDNEGRFNHFEHGSIFWHPSMSTAFEVHGAIHALWAGMGYETSFLGYPISDEHDINAGKRSDFQNGAINFTRAGAEVQPQRFVAHSPITVRGDIALGGWGTLTLFSDGTTHFMGHLHDDGFPSYDSVVIFTVSADDFAYVANHTGHTEGTDVVSVPHRDLDWDEWGTSDAVRKNWAKIRSGGVGYSHIDVTSDWSAQKITEDVVALVGTVVGIFSLPPMGGKKSPNKYYQLPDTSEGFDPGPPPGCPPVQGAGPGSGQMPGSAGSGPPC